ncbi:helix-turn-helix domain-containing protein [Nonomuraea sp. NPDC005650]|uniref:helix-turn-helix domain-containing protein n=1 Tax=Nonomuraea sp. NPDC005650 TaxID=3157045 RepID=UPI0033A49736
MDLTFAQACDRLGISRSTANRWMQNGRLAGVKRHRCGVVCTDPAVCKHTGAWEFTEAQIAAALQPSETGL